MHRRRKDHDHKIRIFGLKSRLNWPRRTVTRMTWAKRRRNCSRHKSPLEWSAEKDLKWKVKVPDKGHVSPVIWDEALFLVSADEDTGERILIAPQSQIRQDHLQENHTRGPHRKGSSQKQPGIQHLGDR